MGPNARFYRPVKVNKIRPRHPELARRRKQHLTTDTVFFVVPYGGALQYSNLRPLTLLAS